MKRSDWITIAALAFGAFATAGCRFYFELPWIGSIIVGLLVSGGLYTQFLRIAADESVVNSKTINRD
jgi:hypothetical protein